MSKLIEIKINVSNKPVGAFAIRSITSDSSNRMFFSYDCSGNEASLQSCPKNTLNGDVQYWYYRPRAAVECQQMNINLTSKTRHCISS